MKKILLFILSATLLFSLLCGCDPDKNTPAVNSSSEALQSTPSSLSESSSLIVEETSESLSLSSQDEESSEEQSLEESSSESEEQSSQESSSENEEQSSQESSSENEGTSEEGPTILIEGGKDLATSAPFLSRAPENYGTNNNLSLQSAVVSYNSTVALKGVFNSSGAYVYDKYQVWTWASLCLQEYYGHPVDLEGKVLTYDVKTDNCGVYSSFIVVAPNGQRANEATFSLVSPAQTAQGITCSSLSNGWRRVTIDFTKTYGTHPILNDAAELFIMFTNQDCADPARDSVFYIDNMSLADAPSIPDTSEESSSVPETSEEEPPVVEYGDLATSLTIQSKAPDYGAVANLSYDTTVVSIDSIASLKGVFSATGADAYQGYKVWTWAELCLAEYYESPVDLVDFTLTYDVRMENCGIYSSFILVAPDGSHSKELTFDFNHPSSDSVGVVSQPLNNGWYRVTVHFYGAFADDPSVLEEVSSILIMFSNQASGNGTFYLDNMSLVDIRENLNNPFEYEDFATEVPFRSQAPGYGAISTFSYDTQVICGEYSDASLKGVFNPKGANVYQGYIVWTWAELCLAEYYESPFDLVDFILAYDVKTENCGEFSSFILVAADGSRSKELTFAFNNPDQTYPGITCEALEDGWYHVEINFTEAYGEDDFPLDEVSSLLIMFSNQDCDDRDADSVYYLDNMYVYYDGEFPDDEYPDDDLEEIYFPEELDLASSAYVLSTAPATQGVVSELTVQSEVTSTALFESTAALKGTFFANDTVKTWVEFQAADFYAQFDITSIPLKNSILYFEVKTENCGVDSSILLVSPDGTYSREVEFALNDYEATNKSVLCVDWGNGWTGVLVDVGTAFATEAETFESIATVIVTFTNKGYEALEEDSVFYIDNFLLTALPDGEELEDFATNAPFVSRAPENYGVHNTLTVQSDVVFGNSTAALMGVFNNEGADVYNGYAVWTWACLCLEEFIGMPVPCKDLYLTFNAKVENGKQISSLILVARDGTRSQEMTFDFNDPSKTYPGITCVALSDGWYQITIDFNTTFSSELYVLDEVSEMLFVFTNENCENPEENTVFYIDNMVFTDVNPDEEPNENPDEEPDDVDPYEPIDYDEAGMDLTTNAPVISAPTIENGANCLLAVQSDVVCKTLIGEEGTSAALQGSFNTLGYTQVVFQLAQFAGSSIDLTDIILYYEILRDNCGSLTSIQLISSMGTHSQTLTFDLESFDEMYADEYVVCLDLGNGWVSVFINMAIAFEGFPLDDVTQLIVTYNNVGREYDDKPSHFYMDNMFFVPLDTPSLQPEEMNDLATTCPTTSIAPLYGTECDLTFQGDVVSENSAAALQGVFNNVGVQTHQGNVWTQVVFYFDEYAGEPVTLYGKYLIYDVKLDNCGIYSSFILVSSRGEYSKEVTFSFVNPAETPFGITCTELSNGWYRVELDFNTAFANNTSVLENVSQILIMYTTQGCDNLNEDSIFYMDNMFVSTEPATGGDTLPSIEDMDLASNCPLEFTCSQRVAGEVQIQPYVTSVSFGTSDLAIYCSFKPHSSNTTPAQASLRFMLDDYYDSTIDAQGLALSFQVKQENCGEDFVLTLAYASGDCTKELVVNLNDFTKTSTGVTCEYLSEGWFEVTVLFDVAFETDSLNEISSLIFSFDNEGCATPNSYSIFYLDNIFLS